MDIFNYIQIMNFYIINNTIKKVKRHNKNNLQHGFPMYLADEFSKEGKRPECLSSTIFYQLYTLQGRCSYHMTPQTMPSDVGVTISQMKTLGSERLSNQPKVRGEEKVEGCVSAAHSCLSHVET